MADVLNLALKKEVFEGLKNGVTNIIPIEKNNWWKKRLMDLDTGRFKPFKEVVATCGSADKFIYEIENIKEDGNNFIITVVNPKMNPEPINPEIINPEIITPVTEAEEDGYIHVQGKKTTEEDVVKFAEEVEGKKPYVAPETIIEEVKEEVIEQMSNPEPEEEEEEQEQEPEQKEKKDVKDVISDMLNVFCKGKNVFVVNMPRVTIRTNGQILGCNKRLLADRDNDVLFEFKKEEFTKHLEDPDSRFIVTIMSYMVNLSENNYVFINRKACNFKTDEYGNITLTIYAVAKRKYLFKK